MILYRPEVTGAIACGANTLRRAVAPTIGPAGGAVITRLEKNIIATRSGSFVARLLGDNHDHEGRAIRILTQAANQVFESRGTGATSTILLAADMIQMGVRHLAAGADPAHLAPSILAAADRAARALRPAPIRNMQQVARIAACHEEHGTIAYQTLKKLPDNAFLAIEPGLTPETTLERTPEREYRCSRADSRSAVPQGGDQTFSPCHFIAADENAPPERILEKLHEIPDEAHGIIIVSTAFDTDTMELILTNRRHGGLPIDAIIPPAFGPLRDGYLSDFEFLAGEASVFPSATTGERFLRVETRRRAEEIEARSAWIERLAGQAKNIAEQAALRERAARLRGSKYTLNVGARSEPEGRWKAGQIEAAISAMIEASQSGGVPGGGAAFWLQGPTTEGEKILHDAGRGILRQIAKNAGLPEGAEQKAVENGIALDVQTGRLSRQIVDPASTTREILRAAASAAAILLTVEVSV